MAGWQWARGRPLVAFSLGSYGAALANGSEFTGSYAGRATEEQLLAFHLARIQVPCPAGAEQAAAGCNTPHTRRLAIAC